jgi:hypothetical protein
VFLLQVWCVRNGVHGGSTYTSAHAVEPRLVEDPSEVYSTRTSRSIWYEYVTKYMVCVCYEVWCGDGKLVCFFENFVFGGLRICRRREKIARQMRVRSTTIIIKMQQQQQQK